MDRHDMARILGRRGGQVRATRLTRARKREIAALGGAARAASLQRAQRIATNSRYLAMVRVLRGQEVRITRLRSFTDRLPGIYPRNP
jgi:hypothetical protein